MGESEQILKEAENEGDANDGQRELNNFDELVGGGALGEEEALLGLEVRELRKQRAVLVRPVVRASQITRRVLFVQGPRELKVYNGIMDSL